MNRRLFLTSMAAASSSLTPWHLALGEQPPSKASISTSAGQQSQRIRAAAEHFHQSLAPERQGKFLFAFPAKQTPTMARFTPHGGPGGPGGTSGPGGDGKRGDGQRPGGADMPGGLGGPDKARSPNRPDGPGGGPGGMGGPNGFAFIGEKYGESMWTNFPVSDVPRPGLRMGKLSAMERTAVHTLLQTVLSPMGYQKVLDIMAADQVLTDEGTNYASGYDAYTVALFGQPTVDAPWMLQFGGHHLGLNVTFVGDRAVCAPLHTGILPSKFQKDGRTIRGLGRENDKAFDLVATLTPDQLRAARINHEISGLVAGPGHPDAKLPPVGLAGSAMTERQRALLFSVAQEWAGVLNEAHCAQRLQDIKRSLPDTHFAWSGPTTHEPDMNGESYFRIHGPNLLIEHAPQGNQGGYKLHVHTVMRDLGNDYGKQLV